ncbi:hypothetical protein MMC19_006913 [Ptychographa xylographoides]|nr:hypothetical protein [Ptychographa xylographoides]
MMSTRGRTRSFESGDVLRPPGLPEAVVLSSNNVTDKVLSYHGLPDDKARLPKKPHKISERDRREIHDFHLLELKTLTPEECYVEVNSTYYGKPAKNEVLGRGVGFVMAMIERLNSNMEKINALERLVVTLRQKLGDYIPNTNPQHLQTHAQKVDVWDTEAHKPLSTRQLGAMAAQTCSLDTHHCSCSSCQYSVAHSRSWYDTPSCRRWLDGPDGVIARTIDIVRVRTEWMEDIIAVSGSQPKDWTAEALVKTMNASFRTP